MIVETAIQKRTGSTPWRMVMTRLSASFLAAVMLNFILPVGISFYTFHGLSYVIDLYKERIKPRKILL
jgi:D-alanyl-lipoteichoic acid acyltransferase DltB (MBOAT superfamily)